MKLKTREALKFLLASLGLMAVLMAIHFSKPGEIFMVAAAILFPLYLGFASRSARRAGMNDLARRHEKAREMFLNKWLIAFVAGTVILSLAIRILFLFL